MKTNMFDPEELVDNGGVTEENIAKDKTDIFLFSTGNCDNFFETIQGKLRNSNDDEIDDPNFYHDLPKCETLFKKARILGEYSSVERHIRYYKQNAEELEITSIHERFHALHHLTKDHNGIIWDKFPLVSPFYKELLAQLFTYIFIRDNCSNLFNDFRTLNDKMPLIYQTYKIFQHYSTQQAEDLYWAVRNEKTTDKTVNVLGIIEDILFNSKKIFGYQKMVEKAVFNGIRKTINRFREQPFLYFTESDLHASLSKDIMDGNSDLFIIGKNIKNRKTVTVPVSLLHHEYPTNFRYENAKLKEDGYSDDKLYLTDINRNNGDRGNYDLVVLNKAFIEDLFTQHSDDFGEALMHIINKDNERAKKRITTEEVLFAIEVKFIHPFNAGHRQMETEVKKDNNKLHLALKTSSNFIKPINLVFCNSDYIQSNDNSIINNIKDYLANKTPDGVCSIFIESYYKNDLKKSEKPKCYFQPISSGANWADELKTMLTNEL